MLRIVPIGSFPEAKDYPQVWDKVKTAFWPRLEINPHPLGLPGLADNCCSEPNIDHWEETQP